MNINTSIVALFDNIADQFPDNPAVLGHGGQITYGELKQDTLRIAHSLINHKINPSEVIGVMLPSGHELIACMIGCFRAGLIYMPIDGSYPDNKVDYMIKKAGSSHIIGYRSELAEKFGESDEGNLQYLDIDELLSAGPNFEKDLKADRSNSSAYIFYTSGSTGKSKAVVGNHNSLHNFISWQIQFFNLGPGHRIAQYAPITFDASLKDILAALCSGGTLSVVPPDTRHKIRQLVEWMADTQITHFHCVPSVFRLVYNYLKSDPTSIKGLKNLQCILLAGEKLYYSDIHAWNQSMKGRVQLYNLYGATEATILSSVHKITEMDRNPHESVSVGFPIQMTKIAIVKQDRICRPGEIGEIYIKTPYLSEGYLDDPELEKKVFVQNPLNGKSKDVVYRTGDYGKYYSDGSIEVIGRNDGMLKINGVRVECGEIIAAARQIQGVRHAEVVPLRSSQHEISVACYYTGNIIPEEEFKAALKIHLTQNAIPSFVVHLNEFPKNLNGKVDLRSLPDPRKILSRRDDDKLEGPVEQRLSKIWREVLQVSSIKRDDSFFDLGGQSIKAIRMISLIYKEFNVDISLKQLFEAKCIANLAKKITSETAIHKNETNSNVANVKSKQYSGLSNGQSRIWLMNQISGASAFNIPLDFQVMGDLRPDVLKKAFELLMLQEPILRVNFREDETGVIQNVVPFKDLILPFKYVENTNNAQLIKVHHEHPFDLLKDVPVRLLVIKNGDDKYYLSLVAHHIVTDGWSMGILVNRVIKFYNSELKEKIVQKSKELPCDYFDYIQREKNYLNSGKAMVDQKYWMNRLKGHEANVSFPTESKRKGLKTFKGNQQDLILGHKYKEKILKYCKKYDCSEFHILLAIVNFTLYKLTGQTNITLGTTVADRPDSSDQNAIGFYVNTIPVRNQLLTEAIMRELVSDIKTNFLNDLSHSRFPFEKIASLLTSNRLNNRSPLFDVLVEVLDTDEVTSEEVKMAHLSISRIVQPTELAQYDIAIRWIPNQDHIHMIVEYNTDLYDNDVIKSIMEMLTKALDELLADTLKTLESISVIQGSEMTETDTFTSQF